MQVDIENYEEECGQHCTQEGCPGHDTGIPQRITVDDHFTLTLDEFNHGDWPFAGAGDERAEIERWKQTVVKIEKALTGFNVPTREAAPPNSPGK